MSRARRTRVLPAPAVAEVERLASDGRGVARIDGKTVFVDGALPGESVRFAYRARRRDFDEGVTVEVLRPSADRTVPRCAHFDTCGGCSLQHLDPAAQLRAKQESLLDNLQRLGKVQPEALLEPLSGARWGYRRKARLGVRYVPGKGRVLVGFREKHSSKVAELSSCEVLIQSVGARLADLAALIGSLSVAEQIPQLEVAAGDDETALVIRHLHALNDSDMERLAAFGRQHGLRMFLQSGGPDSVVPLDGGAGWLDYRLPEYAVEIKFNPTDFAQVHAGMNQRMVARVVELLALEGGERVLDLYCGLGNFTLPLARRAGYVVGVEGDAGLVRRARDNARCNGLDNTEFHAADLASPEPGAAWLAGRYDRVLLDPPRSGAQAIIPYLKGLKPTRIAYVSCHPATLARDAGELVRGLGYRLVRAGVVDMFPHTAHVESVAIFERG
ncbi:MAG: 23S rRNA (uracil(1939)-C(5))-methyltransferase [Chromatiales bacterium 21-64-14]|nr:MAG: 23S rRNA (uracil(1939)-C(5))-methyltransferase [Chromatiales bacterium 21-64-14]HQU16677.1 23S rRNA (uracil(1939)-C(5))-methyltransferase RlmD [Gammaproteobacteria bacterium]